MAIFKCKMCGGTLEINNNESIFECEYCGTTQTLPKLDDDRKNNMYDRANHFRRNNEFDKAMGIYEQILNEDGTDAEAYWSLVLCRYGIEYVEDPATHKRVPTVNRAQYTSIFDDSNYKSALQYADTLQKSIYEEEAKTINEIQKGILEISQKEEPFDVFICYKETDNNGRRTPDSVLANDLYHQLTQEGFKVFFARITLEDKLGSAYEPYIFAALNSAKVMVVLGTKPEFFKAVWVRNEWSRYLALIKNGEKKQLIPAYKDMDPYDLPEEFSHLQAQDMSKLGFMQDLIRGIKKIAGENEAVQTVVKETAVQTSGSNAAPLLERAFIFLEDGKWESADEYFEKVLDMEPKNGEAYLGKLMVKIKIKQREELKKKFLESLETTNLSFMSLEEVRANNYVRNPFDSYEDYKKAMRYGNEQLVNELKECTQYAYENAYANAKEKMENAKTPDDYNEASYRFEFLNEYKDSKMLKEKCEETADKEKKYCEAVEMMNKASDDKEFKEAREKFKEIKGYKDSDELAGKCEQLAQDKIYFAALECIEGRGISRDSDREVSIEDYKMAIEEFKRVIDWRESKEKIEECEKNIERLENEEKERLEAIEKENKRKARGNKIIAVTIFVVVVLLIFWYKVVEPTMKYNSALSLIEEGKYFEANNILVDINEYKDSQELIEKYKNEIRYDEACILMAEGNYEKALTTLNMVSYNYNQEERRQKIDECKANISEQKYNDAIILIEKKEYIDAYEILRTMDDYKDSKDKLDSIQANVNVIKLKDAKEGDCVTFGKYEQDNNLKNGNENIEWIVIDEDEYKGLLLISKYALECMPFNSTYSETTWENSTLRYWLNGTFANQVFVKEERVRIQKNTVYNSLEEDTQDEIFLLSTQEASGYCDDNEIICRATDYSLRNVSESTRAHYKFGCGWWLRTVGINETRRCYVNDSGDVNSEGASVDSGNGMVRPAIWVKP